MSGVGLHGLVASSAWKGLLLGGTGDRMGSMVRVDAVKKGKVLPLQFIEFVNQSLYQLGRPDCTCSSTDSLRLINVSQKREREKEREIFLLN